MKFKDTYDDVEKFDDEDIEKDSYGDIEPSETASRIPPKITHARTHFLCGTLLVDEVYPLLVEKHIKLQVTFADQDMYLLKGETPPILPVQFITFLNESQIYTKFVAALKYLGYEGIDDAAFVEDFWRVLDIVSGHMQVAIYEENTLKHYGKTKETKTQKVRDDRSREINKAVRTKYKDNDDLSEIPGALTIHRSNGSSSVASLIEGKIIHEIKETDSIKYNLFRRTVDMYKTLYIEKGNQKIVINSREYNRIMRFSVLRNNTPAGMSIDAGLVKYNGQSYSRSELGQELLEYLTPYIDLSKFES